jgi:hypothetical protein
VTNSRELGPSEWALGCVFSLELSDAEMDALGGKKTKSTGADQRAWVRYPVRGEIQFRLLPGADESAKTAALVDLSPSGVGLLVSERVEAGTVLTLVLRRHGDKPDRSMLACVVYATDRPDGKCAIGCQFLRELTNAELNELIWRT